MQQNMNNTRANSAAPLILVALRRPRNGADEMRSDPFWEFGSFGLTCCKQRCLLHPRNWFSVQGARLGFVQGGKEGAKLVFLTPPVKAYPFSDRTEVRWENTKFPFTYADAPLLVDAVGNTDFPEIKSFIADVRHHAWTSKFAFKFRTRCIPLSPPAAAESLRVYSNKRRCAERRGRGIAQTYEQALPYEPPLVDRDRRQTYLALRQTAAQKTQVSIHNNQYNLGAFHE